MSQTEEHPFDIAVDANEDVNDLLAGTDGAICEMQFAGAIGYHVNVADGETDPEYLWKTAFLQAIDEVLLDMAMVDADTPGEAREQLDRQVLEEMGPFTKDALAESFEEHLESLIAVQEDKQ